VKKKGELLLCRGSLAPEALALSSWYSWGGKAAGRIASGGGCKVDNEAEMKLLPMPTYFILEIRRHEYEFWSGPG